MLDSHPFVASRRALTTAVWVRVGFVAVLLLAFVASVRFPRGWLPEGAREQCMQRGFTGAQYLADNCRPFPDNVASGLAYVAILWFIGLHLLDAGLQFFVVRGVARVDPEFRWRPWRAALASGLPVVSVIGEGAIHSALATFVSKLEGDGWRRRAIRWLGLGCSILATTLLVLAVVFVVGQRDPGLR